MLPPIIRVAYEALHNRWWSVVGIITLFAYNYLVSQVDNVVNKMEARTMEFMDLLNELANRKNGELKIKMS